jgi:hypothetical protein
MRLQSVSNILIQIIHQLQDLQNQKKFVINNQAKIYMDNILLQLKNTITLAYRCKQHSM